MQGNRDSISGRQKHHQRKFCIIVPKAWSKVAEIDYAEGGFRSTGRFTPNPYFF
jgi:hypothetical protein